jgi:hypothetical protein
MEALKKVTDKTSKSVIIYGDIHAQLKMLCAGKSLKIGSVIENLIRLYLKEYKSVQLQIDNLNESEK